MSQEAELAFALKRERLKRLKRERISNKTREFLIRYKSQFEEMCTQGYMNYIPEEMSRLGHDLKTIESLLIVDPMSARQVSQEVGSYIHSFWGLGREARKVFQESTRISILEAKQQRENSINLALTRYYELVGELDPIVASFAASALNELKNKICTGDNFTKQNVEEEMKKIIEGAEKLSSNWKMNTQKELAQQAIIKQIEDVQESVKTEKIEDNTKLKTLLDKLEDLKSKAISGSVTDLDAQEQIKSVTEETDDVIVEENVRREMVKAIQKWFNSKDFTVSRPRLVDGVVVITAQRPSGNKAQFKLTANNKMWYLLDGYEGQSCLKDISSAKEDWEKVYGINISDEVVFRQNPDRILHKKGQTESDIEGTS